LREGKKRGLGILQKKRKEYTEKKKGAGNPRQYHRDSKINRKERSRDLKSRPLPLFRKGLVERRKGCSLYPIARKKEETNDGTSNYESIIVREGRGAELKKEKKNEEEKREGEATQPLARKEGKGFKGVREKGKDLSHTVFMEGRGGGRGEIEA